MARKPGIRIELPPSFDPAQAMLAKLQGSGLDASDASKLGLEAMPRAPEAMPLDLGGFKIPYHTPKGKPTGYYRFRYLEEPPKPTGFAALAPKKPIRYAQPRGSAPQVYLPMLGQDWPSLLGNPSEPLLVTEGELKAACACKLGFATLGLGGVWSWRAGNQGLVILPELEAIEWKTRKTYIVFDSDAVTNEKVLQAENALARALSGLGAVVFVIRLPPGPGGAKQGLDDYLLARGPASLQALVNEASPWLSFEMLHKLNEEVAYLKDQGRVYVHADARILAPEAFVTHAYAPWRWVDLTGPKPRERCAPSEWLKWRGRSEVEGLTFAPGQGERVSGRINTWTGWGTVPEAGDAAPWLELVRHIFGGNEEEIRWFTQWCAYPLQHPGAKLYSACLLWGTKHGTGKTALAYALGKIHGNGFVEVKNKDLRGGFNGWLAKRTLVYGDEITASDARVDADYLKGLITQHQARINEKFQVPVSLPDCANYIFTSNHPDALFLEDDDRRMFVKQVVCNPLPQAFYDHYDNWLHGDGPKHLHHHLLTVPMSGFNPRARAMDTQSKQNMIEACRSDLATWIADLKENADLICRVNGEASYRKLWTSAELLAVYDPERRTKVTKGGVGRELDRQGFKKAARGMPCITKTGQHRLWIVGDHPELENYRQSEVAALYNAERKGGHGNRKY